MGTAVKDSSGAQSGVISHGGPWPGLPVHWHDRLEEVPAGTPVMVLAHVRTGKGARSGHPTPAVMLANLSREGALGGREAEALKPLPDLFTSSCAATMHHCVCPAPSDMRRSSLTLYPCISLCALRRAHGQSGSSTLSLTHTVAPQAALRRPPRNNLTAAAPPVGACEWCSRPAPHPPWLHMGRTSLRDSKRADQGPPLQVCVRGREPV